MSKWSLGQCSVCVPVLEFCQNFGCGGNKRSFAMSCMRFRRRHRFRFKVEEELGGKLTLQSGLEQRMRDLCTLTHR